MVTVVGNVIYGVDFRKHMDKLPTVYDVFGLLTEIAKDAGSIADTAPCEYVPPDNPA